MVATTGTTSSIVILLVDDDPDCRMLVRDAISECKVSNSVYEMPNGAEALKFLRNRCNPRPGLIFLDIEMPEKNGMQTLEEIKKDPMLHDIPVVMMTGVCEEKQMQRAMELGANSYTIKPANAEQFLRTVLNSTNYWLTIHQYPNHHLEPSEARR